MRKVRQSNTLPRRIDMLNVESEWRIRRCEYKAPHTLLREFNLLAAVCAHGHTGRTLAKNINRRVLQARSRQVPLDGEHKQSNG